MMSDFLRLSKDFGIGFMRGVLPRIFFVIFTVLVVAPFAFAADAAPEDSLSKGLANLKEENYEEAVVDFVRARKEAPESSLAAYYLGVAYRKAQNFAQSQPNLEDAIRLTPHVKEAVMELTDTLYQLNNNEEALIVIDKADKEGIEPARAAFFRGLVFLRLNRNKEAVAAFDRAKGLDPGLAEQAAYQTGVAHIQMGKLVDAKDIFRKLTIRDPNSEIAQLANQNIDAITRHMEDSKPLKLTVGAQYQHDSNVILRPSDLSAAGGISNQSDNALVSMFRADYSPETAGPFNAKAQYSFYMNNHEKLASYDVMSHTASIVPAYNLAGSSINMPISYNYTLVDDQRYMQATSVTPTYMLLTGENHFMQASAHYQTKQYFKGPLTPDEDKNGYEYGLGISFTYMIADGRGLLNARYDINREETDGVNWRYNGQKFAVSGTYPITPRLNFIAGMEAYYQGYYEDNTSFGIKRRDTTYTSNAMFSYKLTHSIDLQAQYVYMRGDSNIAVYDYKKSVVSVGIEYDF